MSDVEEMMAVLQDYGTDGIAAALDLPTMFENMDRTTAELGAVLRDRNVSDDVRRDLLESVDRMIEARGLLGNRVYAEGLDAISQASNLMPNGAVTLLGPGGPGVLYLVGAVINLVPAQGGVLSAAPFNLNEKVTIIEVTVREEDVAADWQVVGNSLRISSDPYSGISQDASIVIWASQTTGLRPISSIFTITGPESGAPLQFFASVLLHGTAAAGFGGITLTTLDLRCWNETIKRHPTAVLKLLKAARDGKLLEAVIEKAQGRLTKPGASLALKTPKLRDAVTRLIGRR